LTITYSSGDEVAYVCNATWGGSSHKFCLGSWLKALSWNLANWS